MLLSGEALASGYGFPVLGSISLAGTAGLASCCAGFSSPNGTKLNFGTCCSVSSNGTNFIS
jgi:hypothetical protein